MCKLERELLWLDCARKYVVYFPPLPYITVLIAVVEMADILSFNLTQTESHAPRVMNSLDLSTKLKYVLSTHRIFLPP